MSYIGIALEPRVRGSTMNPMRLLMIFIKTMYEINIYNEGSDNYPTSVCDEI